MAGSEERLLKEYFDEISRELEDIPQVKMNVAIRSGISGPARYRTSARKRFAVSVAVVLAAAALFAVPWIGKLPKPLEPQNLSAPSQMNEAFTPYFWKAINDTTVASAIEAGLIERVSGVTAEQNGFVLKVDGIAADRKGIMILYSLQNHTGQKARVDNLQLVGKSSSPVNYRYGWALNNTDVPTGTTLYYEILQWAEGFDSLPDEITFELNLGESKPVSQASREKPLAALSVPITLDKGKIARSGEVHTVNKTLTVAGQEILINEVYTSATGIYLEPVYNEQNSKQIFSMIYPRFLLGSNGIFSSMSPVRTVEVKGKEILVFGNDSRSSQPLQFQLDGILALDKDTLKVVIDTEQQQIIKAPDNYLTMSLYTAERGTTMILKHNMSPGKKRFYNALMLDNEFTDSKGQIHSTADLYDIPPYQASADKKSVPVLDYVGLGSNKYAQPLTFTITSYPAPINQKVSLEIRD